MNKTKRRIFNTAVKLFSEKGYDNTNIEEITAIAGVAKGTLYYHFTKKEDIFDMLLEEGLKLLKNNIELKTRNCTKALDKIKAVILIQIKVIVKYESFLNVVLSQMWGEDNKNIKCKKAVFEYINIIEKIIEEGIKNREFYEGNVQALASGIFGITYSSLLYRLKMNRQVNIDDVYNGFIDTVIRGISKKALN
ncbi:MAG: TetR/AcrR family transcriptional regulator [Candidatus Scatovivens sp.]